MYSVGIVDCFYFCLSYFVVRCNLGRPNRISTKTTITANNKVAQTKVKAIYDSNGIQKKLRNELDGVILWNLVDVNELGQTKKLTFGNNFKVFNRYDEYYMLEVSFHKNYSNNKKALYIQYNFDAKKGVVNKRRNILFNKRESFEYDELERLTVEKLNGQIVNQYAYDVKGRLTHSTSLGSYKYKDGNDQLEELKLNQKGKDLFEDRGTHNITFNAFKKAVQIHIPDKQKIDFSYNIFGDRSTQYYGNNDEDKQTRPYRKYYSADKAIEIKHTIATDKYEVITYLDGNPYSATVIQKDKFTSTTTKETLYLHKDYQGSILAISNQQGKILEQRYFDAWGNLKEVKDKNGQLYNQSTLSNYQLILDRGYTSHEHLQGVGLIHMNGRIYDPELRRFINPDNFVQGKAIKIEDEQFSFETACSVGNTNTQNFNRYTYVLNNPLIYTDPSGEFLAELATISSFNPYIIAGVAALYGIAKGINGLGTGPPPVINNIQGFNVQYADTKTFTPNAHTNWQETHSQGTQSLSPGECCGAWILTGGGSFEYWSDFEKGIKNSNRIVTKSWFPGEEGIEYSDNDGNKWKIYGDGTYSRNGVFGEPMKDTTPNAPFNPQRSFALPVIDFIFSGPIIIGTYLSSGVPQDVYGNTLSDEEVGLELMLSVPLVKPLKIIKVVPTPLITNAAKPVYKSSLGEKSINTTRKGFKEILQRRGNKLNRKTLKVLNLTKEQGRSAVHLLKEDLGLPNNFHEIIMRNGDYLHPDTGKLLGNLLDFIY